jgi:hypothetical protein
MADIEKAMAVILILLALAIPTLLIARKIFYKEYFP